MSQEINNTKKSVHSNSDPRYADIYSEDNYEHDSNSKSKKNWASIKKIIEVLSFFILVLTLFVSSLTIKEMRTDRNESYKAVITANPVTEILTTNIAPFGRTNVSSEKEENLDVYITGQASKPENYSREDNKYLIRPTSKYNLKTTCTEILFSNIGQGMATKVSFSCDIQNVYELFDLLMEVDNAASDYFSLKDTSLSYHPTQYYSETYPDLEPFRQEDSDVILDVTPLKTEYSYMLPNGQETYSVKLPIVYSLLFSEILLHNPQAEPSIKLKIEFTDTQGLDYCEYVIIKAANPSIHAFLGRNENDEDDHHYITIGLRYSITTDYSDPLHK